MDWLAQLDMDKFLLFTLVLTRVSGLTMTAPIYGSQEVPMQVRALLAFALAVLIVPTQWDVPLAYPGTMLNYLVFVGGGTADRTVPRIGDHDFVLGHPVGGHGDRRRSAG